MNSVHQSIAVAIIGIGGMLRVPGDVDATAGARDPMRDGPNWIDPNQKLTLSLRICTSTLNMVGRLVTLV